MSFYFRQDHHTYNEEVQKMQERFNKIRAKCGDQWPWIDPDGYFGLKTDKAVREFQRIMGIQSDGMYGDYTHQALVYAADHPEILNPTFTPPRRHHVRASMCDTDCQVKQRTVETVKPAEPSAPPEVTLQGEKSTIDKILDYLKKSVGSMFKTIYDILCEIKDAIKNGIRLPSASEIFKKFKRALGGMLKEMGRMFMSFFTEFCPHAMAYFSKAYEVVKTAVKNFNVERVVNYFKREIPSLFQRDASTWSRVSQSATHRVKSLKTGGGILGIVLSFVGLIELFFDVDNIGTPSWFRRLADRFTSCLEMFVIGLLSEMLMAAIVGAVAGTAVTGGALSVLVIALAALLTMIIGYIIDQYNGDDESLIYHLATS